MQQNENIMVTLNRTEALNKALFDELVAAVSGMDADPGIGAVVVTGSARAFAAGADIKELKSKNYMEMYATDWFRLVEHDPPAHPRGPGRVRLRTGRRLQTGRDVLYIIAGHNAKFGQPEINLGVIPAWAAPSRGPPMRSAGPRGWTWSSPGAFERRVFHSVLATEDQNEGMAAFTKKRAPEFGR
ncbi:hypothetical protein GCM10009589_06530 [Arthrobacter pascens]